MIDTTIYHLLTQEYTLKLAMTPEDIEAVKQVRKEALLPAYQNLADIQDEAAFLYNKDDEQSFIYLLYHNTTQRYVGTIRVFFVNDSTPIQQIPMQIYGHVKGIEALVAEHPVCEVSRLALSPNIAPYRELSALRLRTALTIGLMSTIGISAFLYPCEHIFAIMEPSLHRILKRRHIDFKAIGPAVEYYGARIPHLISRKNLILGSEEILGKITLHYLRQLCAAQEPFLNFIDNHPYLKRSDIPLDSLCRLFKTHEEKITIPLLYEAL